MASLWDHRPLGPVLVDIVVGFCQLIVDSGNWPLLYKRFPFNSKDESHFFPILFFIASLVSSMGYIRLSASLLKLRLATASYLWMY